MEVSEEELREMIRDAIARHTGGGAPRAAAVDLVRMHASHALLALVSGGDPDGRCLIEPAVACTHCGYCQSMGH